MIASLNNISKSNILGGIIIETSILACGICIADTASSPVSRETVSSWVTIHTPNFIYKPLPDSVQRNDLRNESLSTWERYEIVSDTSIRVFFATGTRSCFGNRAVVVETPQEIQIALVEGRVPESLEMCTLEALRTSFLLHTKKPVAGRKVVPLLEVELKR